MAKIFLLYLSCLFIVEVRHDSHLVAAGVVGSICLLLGRIVGENMEKGNNGQFLADAAFVKWIRRKVNGSLIHANRLAFGRTRGYLCIAAAPWREMHQPSLYERESTTSNRNVKYNPNA